MKQGPSTLVVSLPSSWVKKHGVKKGKIVFLEERGRALLVSLTSHASESQISLDVSGTMPMTNRIVGALYKAGFDMITLTYSLSKEAEEILRAVPSLLGHQVISHDDKTIVLKKMMREDAENFEISYRKCFHILEDMFRDMVRGMKEKNDDVLKDVIVRDKTLAVFSDYTRRLLLSNHASEHVPEKYLIAVQLEKIGDRIKHIATVCVEEKKNSKNALSMISEVFI